MLISKSDFINLCKSMGKDPEFEKLRAEVLSILKKQAKTEGNEKDIHKSLLEMDKSFKYFDKDEFIIKSGYPVGTIREWKGRKYIKVAPNKWKPKYDSESKGAKNSITRLMKQVENCKNVEELMNLVMENKQRFTDANGNHLPIVDKLRAAADKKNDALSSGGSSTEDKLSSAKKNLADATKRKAAIRDKYGVDSKEFEAAQKEENDAADKRNELLKQRESEAKERIHSRFSKKESEVKNTADENYIKNSNNKELKAKVNAAIKKYGVVDRTL